MRTPPRRKEASGKGFPIEKGVLRAWTKYQKEQCRIFRRKADDAFGELDEAYRLYTLAVAGSPEAGSMNRLKETAGLGYRAKWVLASAYAVTGKTQIAKQLIGTITDSFEEYAAGYATYGSGLRDKALALEALALTDDIGGALPLALEISEKVNAGSYSTQEAGFAAVAMDRLHGKFPAEHVAADVTAAGKKLDVSSAKAVLSLPVQGDVNVRNTGAGPLYATLLTTERRPAGTPVPARADGLSLRVAYSLTDGTPVNPASIRQGTEFTASVTVAGTSAARDYRNLALRMKVPSGWEILNQRLLGILDGEMYDYQDIRDDRCDWFFDLPHGTAKTFQIRLRAAYEGSYVLPAVTCEAMYDPHVAANTASGKAPTFAACRGTSSKDSPVRRSWKMPAGTCSGPGSRRTGNGAFPLATAYRNGMKPLSSNSRTGTSAIIPASIRGPLPVPSCRTSARGKWRAAAAR